jgi:DNA adenine methylase
MANLSLIRWAGGKGRQLDDLLPFIPNGRVYVEPFGGGGSVLLNKARSEVEVYNDLDHSLVNLFTVVRDNELFDEFARVLDWTPYSRENFVGSLDFESVGDSVLAAVKFYTVLNQSISGKRLAGKWDWARAKTDNLADRWVLRQYKLGAVHDRLKHVQIECRDAIDILQEWDSEETVFYCDPPYVLETRKKQKYYAVEPGDEYHKELVACLKEVRGAVVLSGYLHPTYNVLLEAGWVADSYGQNAMMTVHDEGAVRDKRMEVVWRNARARDHGLKVPLPFPSYEESGAGVVVGTGKPRKG